MTKKKQKEVFLLDEYQDTPWISRNRELNAQTYDLTKNQLNELGKQDQQYYEGLASKAMQSAWGDYNRNYQKAVNQNLARNYGRTGSTASTSGGYVTDSLQRQYNDATARLATQQAQYQDQFINSALNRDLALLQAYYTPFTDSGKVTEEVDLRNYDIRQENKRRNWINDQIREANKADIGKIAGGAIAGAAKGFMSGGGPWGALAGAVAGAADGYYNSGTDMSGAVSDVLKYNADRSKATQQQNLSSNIGGKTYSEAKGSPFFTDLFKNNDLGNLKFSWQQ